MNQSIYKGIFSPDKNYPAFSVVSYNDLDTESTVAVQVLMISAQEVPAGSNIKDSNYWLPYNVENVNMLGAKSGITYDEVQKMIEEAIEPIKADIELLKEEVEALSGTVEEMNGTLTNLSDSVENLDTEMATAQADILELKNKPDYQLPIASGVMLGGIMIGDGLVVDSIGRVSVANQGGGTVTVDDTISSTSENPVQNKVIEKYLEPVLGKPQEQGVPTVNLTGASYPINTLTNENGVIFSWVTSDESGSDQYYYEWIIDADVKNLGLKMGLAIDSIGSTYLPFLAYTIKPATSINTSNVKIVKYSTAGIKIKEVKSSSDFFKGANWNGQNFVRTDTSYSGIVYYFSTTLSVPRLLCSTLSNSTYNNDFIPATTKYINIINGNVLTGEFKSWTQGASNASLTEPYPVFTQWWSECNVTYGGAVAKTPFAQLQDDVAELKTLSVYERIEVPTEKGWYDNENLDTPLPSELSGTGASDNKCYLYSNGEDCYAVINVGLMGENATLTGVTPICKFATSLNLSDNPKFNFDDKVAWCNTIAGDSGGNTLLSIRGGFVKQDETINVEITLNLQGDINNDTFDFSTFAFPLFKVDSKILQI